MKTGFIFSAIISFLLIICYTPAEAALNAPTITEAAALSGSQIAITWTDTNKRKVKFEIERSLSQSGGFVLIGTTGKSVKTFIDSGLAPETSYYYRVRSYRSLRRRGTEYSPYSNIAGATTQSVQVCGNGIVEAGEQCDDGNGVNGDGCENDCKVTVNEPPTTENIKALHDSSSPQYERNCTECHGDVLTRQSLDPSIPTAHISMLPHTPGNWGSNNQCRWCHRTVDLAQGSAGNLRRNVDAVLCALCHGPFGPGKQFYQTGIPPDNPDGAFLYELVCAACHGDLSDSEVSDESAGEIQGKIDEDEGGMGPLNVLSSQEIQAIAVALGSPPAVCTDSDGDGYYDEGGSCGPRDCADNNPAIHPDAVENCNDGVDNDCDGYIDEYDPECGGVPPVNGAVLYEQHCASCHRPLANTEMRGKTANKIQEMINQNKGGMGSLSFLTFEEIQAIADALEE